jgi:hypothetical protein
MRNRSRSQSGARPHAGTPDSPGERRRWPVLPTPAGVVRGGDHVSDDVTPVPRAARALRSDWADLAAGPPNARAIRGGLRPRPPRAGTPLVDPRHRARDTPVVVSPAHHARTDPAGGLAAVHRPRGPRPVPGVHLGGNGARRRAAADRIRPPQLRHRPDALVALRFPPVMRASGLDVTRSTAGRLAGEAVLWLPTAYGSATWASGRIGTPPSRPGGSVTRTTQCTSASTRRGGCRSSGCSAGATRRGTGSPAIRSGAWWKPSTTSTASRSPHGYAPAGGGAPTGRTKASSSAPRSPMQP